MQFLTSVSGQSCTHHPSGSTGRQNAGCLKMPPSRPHPNLPRTDNTHNQRHRHNCRTYHSLSADPVFSSVLSFPKRVSYEKECALAHSRAERGRLRHVSSSRECASRGAFFCHRTKLPMTKKNHPKRICRYRTTSSGNGSIFFYLP